MYKQTLHWDRIHFCCYCLESFSTAQIPKRHVHASLEINVKQMIKMAKKDLTVKFEDYARKIKPLKAF